MEKLRPLYDAYMRYKHAKTDAERDKAKEELLNVHGLDVEKILNELEKEHSK